MTATATAGAVPAIERRAWHVLFITSIAMFLVSMDVSIVSVALPEISSSFPDASRSTLSWIFTAYNITFAALLLIAGKGADRFGRKRAFLFGLGLFMAASVLGGVAPNIEVLILARALQAVGGAALYPASLALLLPEFPPQRRATAIGVWGAMAGFAAALGPTVGALLVDALDWRWVFFINVPFVLAAQLFGRRVLRETLGDEGTREFDAVSVPLAAIAVGLLVLGIVQGEEWGWGDARTLACFAATAVLLPLFLRRSRLHPTPLLDLDVFRVPGFGLAVLCQGLYVAGFFGWLVLMPTFLVQQYDWSPLQAGFAIAPSPAVSAILSPMFGRWADRIGQRWIVTISTSLAGLGSLSWILLVDETADYWSEMFVGMLLTGIGASAGFATLTGAAMSRVPSRFYAMGGAARSTCFQLFTAVGIAVSVAVVGRPAADGLLEAWRASWWVSTLATAACAVLMAAWFRPRQQAD